MAQPGIDRPSDSLNDPQPGAKLVREDARQGQNIRGMLVVLVAGILLVSVAYSVMLALQTQPAAVTEQSRDNAVAATQDSFPTTPDQGAQPAPPPVN